MSVQKIMRAGKPRYRARVKSHGREVATKVFDRKGDAIAWEQEQLRQLRRGEWFDPRRGRVALDSIAADWLSSRSSLKRRTREADSADWDKHIKPRFGRFPLASITTAEISAWAGSLVASGYSPSSVTRYLATLRSMLAFAVHDGRLSSNAAAAVKPPSGGHTRREGSFLTVEELANLAAACDGPYADVVLVLGYGGLRWGELAGLKVSDRVSVPGPGLRLQRAVLASGSGGDLFVDSLKNKRSRTVPLVADLVPIIEKWSAGKEPNAWLFSAPKGGPLSEPNWKRSVGWKDATAKIGKPNLRVHDLRHTAASVWLAAQADPKVVQRILGHASAAMTMDLYGHLVDQNLWDAAKRVGGTSGARKRPRKAAGGGTKHQSPGNPGL